MQPTYLEGGGQGCTPGMLFLGGPSIQPVSGETGLS